jgi:hypothetical protein
MRAGLLDIERHAGRLDGENPGAHRRLKHGFRRDDRRICGVQSHENRNEPWRTFTVAGLAYRELQTGNVDVFGGNRRAVASDVSAAGVQVDLSRIGHRIARIVRERQRINRVAVARSARWEIGWIAKPISRSGFTGDLLNGAACVVVYGHEIRQCALRIQRLDERSDGNGGQGREDSHGNEKLHDGEAALPPRRIIAATGRRSGSLKYLHCYIRHL